VVKVGVECPMRVESGPSVGWSAERLVLCCCRLRNAAQVTVTTSIRPALTGRWRAAPAKSLLNQSYKNWPANTGKATFAGRYQKGLRILPFYIVRQCPQWVEADCLLRMESRPSAKVRKQTLVHRPVLKPLTDNKGIGHVCV
jgi:hypothetical protein